MFLYDSIRRTRQNCNEQQAATRQTLGAGAIRGVDKGNSILVDGLACKG